jgi:hypothetical protein
MMKTETVEKLLNCFLLLHLKYENESENSKAGHENERELTKYREFRKQTKIQYEILTRRTKCMTKYIHDQVAYNN